MADEFIKAALYGIKTFNKKVKEKIGMQKLIELLNEYENERYEKEIKSSNYYWGISYGKLECSVGGTDHDLYDDEISMVIKSKDYGFIKWLVDNDKIDRDEIIINSDFMPIAFDRKGEKYEWSEEKQLLMLLSISDTPIEDLISYLK